MKEEQNLNKPVGEKTYPVPPNNPFRILVSTIEKDFFGGADQVTNKYFTDIDEAHLFYLRCPQDQWSSTRISIIKLI